MEESQTHNTRSVGSNPTHGVEVSEAVLASEVGDGGEAAASRFYLQLIGLVVARRLLADDDTNKGCLFFSLP